MLLDKLDLSDYHIELFVFFANEHYLNDKEYLSKFEVNEAVSN